MNANEWVRDVLATKVKGDKIVLNENQDVDISIFCTFFKDAIEDNTQSNKYQALSGSHTFMWGDPPQEYTRTAAELGYQTFFDVWHSEGLI